MKIYSETRLSDFHAWSGAKDTLERVISEGKDNLLESILEDLYPDGIDETTLNDILWFEPETVFDWCGIVDDDDDTDDESDGGNE